MEQQSERLQQAVGPGQIDEAQLAREAVARMSAIRREAAGQDRLDHQTALSAEASVEPAGSRSAGRRAAAERLTQAREDHRPILANVYADPQRHTVTLLLDDVTANIVLYAVRVLAADSEAHAREVRQVGAAMPPDSYGAANRRVIAARHERIAGRLRALERSYYDVITTPGRSLSDVSNRRGAVKS